MKQFHFALKASVKTLQIAIALTAVIFLSISIGNAQWLQTNGPYGAWVYALANAGGSVLAGTGNGVFRSTNSGTGWSASNTGINTTAINAFAMSEILYAGTANAVYMSTDYGATWSSANSGHYVLSLAAAGTIALSGSYDDGVFLSTDSGANWTPVNNGLSNTTVQALAIIGGDFFASVNGGVYVSSDSGKNWTQSNTGLTNTNATCFTVKSPDIFVGTWGGGVFRSTNNGSLWTSAGLSGEIVMTMYASGSTLYAGTGNDGLFFTTDNGAHWTSTAPLPMGDVHAVSVDGTNLYVGTRVGVHISADTGKTWTLVNTGIIADDVAGLASIGANLYAALLYGGVFLSTNGMDWTARSNGMAGQISYTLATDSATLYEGDNGGAYRSSNGGATWVEANTGFLTYNPVYSFACADGRVLSLGSDGVYRSTDSGATWVKADSLTPTGWGYAIGVSPATVSGVTTFYVSQYDSGIFTSTDYGTTWKATNTGIPMPTTMTALHVVLHSVLAGSDRGILVSTNNGAQWSSPITSVPGAVLTFASSGANVFAGTTGSGVYYSADSGRDWTQAGLPGMYVNAILIYGNDLYAAVNGSGVWHRPLSEMVAGVQAKPTPYAPTSFRLMQNCPNPFNPSSTITFELSRESFVSLKVYNGLGQEVATLVNEEREAGRHEVLFNAATLPSGVYFYRLSGGGFTDVKKLLLLK